MNPDLQLPPNRKETFEQRLGPLGGPVRAVLERFDVEALSAPSAREILEVCLELALFLIEKNRAYGDSALKPVRVFSKADPAEQIRVRMDDKLSRLMRGEAAGEDALKDLVGYWVLLQIADKGG